jgi:hypothetical protein
VLITFLRVEKMSKQERTDENDERASAKEKKQTERIKWKGLKLREGAQSVLVVLLILLVSLFESVKRVEVRTAEPTFDFAALPLPVFSLHSNSC